MRPASKTIDNVFGRGGSDHAADRWREVYRLDGVGGLELNHLYRVLALAGEALPKNYEGAPPFAPRSSTVTAAGLHLRCGPATLQTSAPDPGDQSLCRRFPIHGACVAADHGMIHAEMIAELEARRRCCILRVRKRTDKLVREPALDDPAPFIRSSLMKPRSEVDYEAKPVTLAGRRYIARAGTSLATSAIVASS